MMVIYISYAFIRESRDNDLRKQLKLLVRFLEEECIFASFSLSLLRFTKRIDEGHRNHPR